jgi:asparagine synthetase B (glutamine-hydrolysing)
MDWHLVICFFFFGAGAVYFASEMKALKDDCERFEIFPPGHIYSSKSGQQQTRTLCYET